MQRPRRCGDMGFGEEEMNFIEATFCLTGLFIWCLGGVVLTGYVIWWLTAKTLETLGALEASDRLESELPCICKPSEAKQEPVVIIDELANMPDCMTNIKTFEVKQEPKNEKKFIPSCVHDYGHCWGSDEYKTNVVIRGNVHKYESEKCPYCKPMTNSKTPEEPKDFKCNAWVIFNNEERRCTWDADHLGFHSAWIGQNKIKWSK